MEGKATGEITTEEELNERLDELVGALQKTIESKVPEKKQSPHMKRWWSRELTDARRTVKRLGRDSWERQDIGGHPAHERYRKARNDYGQMIKDTKKAFWRAWLEEIHARSVWDANKFITAPPTDGGRTRIPALKVEEEGGETREVQDNEGKAKLFHQAFFYEPPEVTNIPEDTVYPGEKFAWTPITDTEIRRAISKLNPFKAHGLSGIPNVVLTKTKDVIIPFLGPIYRATFAIGVYPKKWKVFNTAVLRKTGKDDYSTPNAYRPIALLDTIAKVLSSCVKNRLTYYAEKTNMLPKMQFGGRPGRATTDSLHLLMTFIKDAWRKGHEVVALFLDVKGAFPNTVPRVLAHDMRRKGVPEIVVQWFENKLERRETVISFDDYKSERIPVNSGLDQGCNTSGMCYNFYSASQIEGARRGDGELATAWADDTIFAASGEDMEEAARKVVDMMGREGGGQEWAERHFSLYEWCNGVTEFGTLLFTLDATPEGVAKQ
ncbi:hypothetical protein D9615_000965 [Tricholomella constricta]|uniref:Reverse transcriptase domain-containing protein n=1 Tax=Tricholomella constricta TaxID=117010 RepID=A0A8H5HKR6_9AGAR|nr:hypothetical protein D9615_000965 [Tricholomella constricta]